MTKEEVNMTIDYLKEMQENYIEGEGYERHPLPEWYALDKAIEALEQEPILDKIFCIVHPLSIMSTSELEHKAIMQIAEMLEPLCLLESEDKE